MLPPIERYLLGPKKSVPTSYLLLLYRVPCMYLCIYLTLPTYLPNPPDDRRDRPDPPTYYSPGDDYGYSYNIVQDLCLLFHFPFLSLFLVAFSLSLSLFKEILPSSWIIESICRG